MSTKKILLWAGFVGGIIVVSFPSMMLMQRIGGFKKEKSDQIVKKPPEDINMESEDAVTDPVQDNEQLNYPAVTENGILFQYKSDAAQKVFVAGSFNGWDGRQGVMTKNSGGIWEKAVKIKPGKYVYKLKVDGVWMTDLNNKISEDDNKGGRVSVLNVE